MIVHAAWKRFILLLLMIASLMVVALFIYLQIRKPDSYAIDTPVEISPPLARTELEKGALLLDVREQNEYDQEHIAGSKLIPLGDLPARLGEIPNDRLIIVMCRSGARSVRGRDTLLAAGFAHVTSMQGGIQSWMASGFPVE